jgi:hypothetical protein
MSLIQLPELYILFTLRINPFHLTYLLKIYRNISITPVNFNKLNLHLKTMQLITIVIADEVVGLKREHLVSFWKIKFLGSWIDGNEPI